MLNVLKNKFTSNEILLGNYGIEREGLRVDKEGKLSLEPHPEVFGDKVNNPYITIDFSESQVEVITPTFNNIEDTYNFAKALYDIVALEIGDEYIWPQSMPCITPDDDAIPVAEYKNSKEGDANRIYREKLLTKYGGKKQLISGIHFNFSFTEDFIKKLYREINTEIDYKKFRSNIYLKIARNYLRYRWLIVYLLGSTTTMHSTYVKECVNKLELVASDSYSNKGALSYRNGCCGYKNKIDLYPNYNSVEEYVESINNYIKDGLIDSHKEVYSQVRLKAKNNNDYFNSILENGIEYLEYRTIDINPFERGGISLEDLKFMQLFNIYLLTKEESNYENWQEEANCNQIKIATVGQNDITLKRDGIDINKNKWALEILNEILMINNELKLKREDIVKDMINKINDPTLTYANKISKLINRDGFIEAHLNLAKKYKEEAYNNRFKLIGYEDLELSTQILMKEAIKRGIKVDLIDRSENFILLSNNGKEEYIKQATKTSVDSYSTVLVMENKLVTKTVLRKHNIRVPQGKEFTSFEEAITSINEFIDKPIVVKPKSTKFGLGISIFPNCSNEGDIIKALTIAFKNDNTVLVEEFISGKEYRFLVINNKVVGVLHRVPANVIGDGERTITQLVEIKNQDPLRGYHYRTPLEKIKLEENAELFLKQKNKNFNYVPKKDEVVYLRENSNISTGGDSIDYTDDMPEKFKNIAIEAAKAVGAKICGVDMMIEDYSNEESNYAIIELNFNPAIHIHSYPYKGKERKIAVEILELLHLL